jgi:cob(I)alamin adenosyltransferase
VVKAERESLVATRKGDDGSTGLLFGGHRIYKDDLHTEAFGAVDEAVAALGIVRAEADALVVAGALAPTLTRLSAVILRIQRDLFVVGAELATTPGAEERQRPGETRVTEQMVTDLDELLAEAESSVQMPREFVVPGETRLSAAIELARTVVRRAERRAVSLARAANLPEADQRHVLPYLNRLADLLWVLARAAEQAEAKPAKPSNPRDAEPVT